MDMGATYSAMPAYSSKTKVSQVSVMGVYGLISIPQITEPLPYMLQDTPNLAYIFKTLNLTCHLLNNSNHTLDGDLWICLSTSSPGGLALPISTIQWTHINTSLLSHIWGKLSFYHICMYSTDQIQNPDILLASLLTNLTPIHKRPAIGGPITSAVHLQQQAPFCFYRQSSIDNS